MTELDEMVEAGCVIPSADELAANKNRSTRRDIRKTSSTKSKGSNRSSSTKRGLGSAAGSLNAGMIFTILIKYYSI